MSPGTAVPGELAQRGWWGLTLQARSRRFNNKAISAIWRANSHVPTCPAPISHNSFKPLDSHWLSGREGFFFFEFINYEKPTPSGNVPGNVCGDNSARHYRIRHQFPIPSGKLAYPLSKLFALS
ncbi:hypothetical protein [Hymenobacter sedentarius]|uniref:hypothetical protein n=1 Tax=Hymenobacter sedentarius TaxID=1411621 RepID=UPI0012FDD583|nr:hypothetical protein [Hymenobacter sedentarius]